MKQNKSQKHEIIKTLKLLLDDIKRSSNAQVDSFNCSRGIIEGPSTHGFRTFIPDPEVHVELKMTYGQGM